LQPGKEPFPTCDSRIKLSITTQNDHYYAFYDRDHKKTAYKKLEEFLGDNATVLQKGGIVYSESHFWTVTECDRNTAFTLCLDDEEKMYFTQADKNTTTIASVRPFILFGGRNLNNASSRKSH